LEKLQSFWKGKKVGLLHKFETDEEMRIASWLIASGVQPKDRVAVALPRGREALVVIYSVLLIGAVYVPLDISSPDARLSSIVSDAGAALVVGQGERKQFCPEGVKWLALEAADLRAAQLLPYPSEEKDLAAILYTSGSSGRPKGVALSHLAMGAFADWMGTTFSIGKETVIASLSPFYFDLSVFDLFTSRRFGAKVHFMPQEAALSPLAMVEWLKDHRITHWYTVPTILTFLTLKGNLTPASLPAMQKIFFAGEVFPLVHLLALLDLLPHVEFYNLFGPTETNVCTYWPVDRKKARFSPALPIGYPACGDTLMISEDNELLVKGPSLMSGYFSKGGIVNPCDEQGWYHTGDGVSLGKEGELYYHGRLDRMIKCQGFRIAPEEVERVLLTFPGVIECTFFGIEKSYGKTTVACVGAQEPLSHSALMHYLKKERPEYMIPHKVMQFAKLPRLGNGKLDLQELKKLVLC
jgi:L-proline---[L-prolyl-carrier protein] ligase